MIQRKKLGEIANISAGQGAPQGAENYSEEGTPFVKAGDLFDLVNGKHECNIQKVSEQVAKKHRLKLYPKGTVLFAKSGMSCMKGYVYATNAECYVVSHLACIMPFDVDSKYLKYYFEYHKPNQLVKDASYPSISLADIAEMPINVFDDQTEAKIVDNLDAVNSLIAKSKEELGLLDNIVKSRFVEMFEKGEFERIPFEAFCEFLRNGASIKQTKGAGGYPITRIETLANDAFNLDRLGYANITELKGFEKYILQKGDILISHINSVAYLGRAVQYRGESNTPIIHGMNLLCARLRHDCNSTYVEYFFKTPMAKDYISTITKKAVNQASITTTDLKKMLIPAPPLELQNRFAAFVAEVDKSKLAVKQSLEKLETLKKSLMQEYFG